MKVVGKFFHLYKYFLIANNNKNTESEKQLIEKDDETASVASEDEEKSALINHPVQNADNFSDDENYYNDEQLFGANCTLDKVSLSFCILYKYFLEVFYYFIKYINLKQNSDRNLRNITILYFIHNQLKKVLLETYIFSCYLDDFIRKQYLL